MIRRRWTFVALATAMAACSHADSYEPTVPVVGPSGSGPDIRLTFNGNQDYWPTWTQDGRGILYSYVQAGSNPDHRCVGLLPAAGGAALWTLCDIRAPQLDSVSSFPAYALDSTGRLLYVEAISKAGSSSPDHNTLFLADTAHPFARQQLLSLPAPVSGYGATVSWLSDIVWTGTNSFYALAADFSALGHCFSCAGIDTLFPGVGVVQGTITAAGASLTLVAGTSGASGYSFAEAGATIVFTKVNDFHLFKVPAAGGAVATVASLQTSTGGQLLGVSCKASTCVVALDPVTLSDGAPTFPSLNPSPLALKELRGVSLATGVVQSLRTISDLVATPQISPANGDVVAQVGGLFGHLQTVTNSGSDLHLYLGLVP